MIIRDKQQIGVLSQVVGGNRGNDPNFNGVNIYGDETSANMLSFCSISSRLKLKQAIQQE